MLSETKIDASFLLSSYSNPFRLNIPSKVLLMEENPIEGFFVEINLQNEEKSLIRCCYNP